jgi:hypothetical protein
VDSGFVLPNVDDRASKFLAFDADGNPVASSGGIDDAIPVSAFGETLIDDANAQAARTTLGFTGSGGTTPTSLIEDLSVTKAKLAAGAATGSKRIETFTASKTSNYIATIEDDIVLCDSSGGTFTVTLPAAASSTGKVLRIFKTDSSFTAVTIDGNGAETINGSATTTINTQYEQVTLACNGTAWFILERKHPKEWTSFTPTGAWSTNTTYAGRRRRNGDSCEFDVTVSLGGQPENVTFSLNIPDVAIDTSKMSSTAVGDTTPVFLSSGIARDNATAEAEVIVIYNTSTASVGVLAKSASGSFVAYSTINRTSPWTWAIGDGLQFRFTVPMTGWKG